MDTLETPSAQSLGPPPGEGRGPGRPPMSAQQRAVADERYGKMVEMMEALPADAKEYRLAVYPARWRSGTKANFQALEKVLFSRYKDQNFADEGTFSSYLLEKYGAGRYFIEPQDEHGQRLIKLGTYTLIAGNEEDMDDDDDFDGPPPRRRGWGRDRYRDRDDDGDEDPREARANVADLLSANQRQNSAQVASVAKESTNMMTMLMHTSQTTAEARAAEERRREDVRAEERRRDEIRAEERRREAEQERREREEREDRRREEMRDREKRDEERRREEHRILVDQSNKRTELLIGAASALAPVLLKVFEKKDSPLEAVMLAKMNEKPAADPVVLMLLKSVMDKDAGQNASSQMIQQMGEMSKISAQMTADQMRAAMSMSNEINAQMMKKAMEMMSSSPQGQTPEGKSFIEQMMTAVASAADIVKTLVPPTPPAAQQQGRLAHRAAPTADGSGVPVNGTAPAVNGTAPAVNGEAGPAGKTAAGLTAEEAWAAMTPAEREAELAKSPRGVKGVLSALQVIQQERYHNQTEYQQVIQYLISEMPLNLRVAVLNGDQASVIGICKPVIDQFPEYKTWMDDVAVQVWTLQFVQGLPASIEAVHGKADVQRAQLEAEIAAAATGAPAPAAAPATDATPPPTGEAAPVVDAKAPIPGPGSVAETLPDGPQIPLPDAPSETSGGPTSHLDPNEP